MQRGEDVLEEKRPGLTVTEAPDGYLRKQLVDYDGTVLLDETILPHEDLIRFTDRSVKPYRKRLKELEAHPLFQESLDVSLLDLRDLIEKAFAFADSLQAEFPEAYFFTRTSLEDVLMAEDDGSASFLLHTGMRILEAVRIPYITAVRMRNIMEVCFGTTEGLTQQKRWERTATIYPVLYNHAFAVRWKPDDQNWAREYEMRSLLELYCFELCAALRSRKRISRCRCCWRYFVPKTSRATDYCDRQWRDQRTCKQHGANLKRKGGPAEDRYQKAFQTLRNRFYEREYRAYADPANALAVPYGSYGDWIEEASVARREYLDGSIDGEEFLQRLNPENEELDLGQFEGTSPAKDFSYTPWEKLVEGDLSFDPSKHFQTMHSLDLSQGADAQWEVLSAREQAQAAKHGNISLREKYRKK